MISNVAYDIRLYKDKKHSFCNNICAFMTTFKLKCDNCIECVQFEDIIKGKYKMCCNHRMILK